MLVASALGVYSKDSDHLDSVTTTRSTKRNANYSQPIFLLLDQNCYKRENIKCTHTKKQKLKKQETIKRKDVYENLLKKSHISKR